MLFVEALFSGDRFVHDVLMMLQGMTPNSCAGQVCVLCLCLDLTIRSGHGRCPGLMEESFYSVGCSFLFLGHIQAQSLYLGHGHKGRGGS